VWARRADAEPVEDERLLIEARVAEPLELAPLDRAAVERLAAARLKDYIDSLLPGFNDHYQRVERHAADYSIGRNAPMDVSSR